jgi:hypothetical protein
VGLKELGFDKVELTTVPMVSVSEGLMLEDDSVGVEVAFAVVLDDGTKELGMTGMYELMALLDDGAVPLKEVELSVIVEERLGADVTVTDPVVGVGTPLPLPGAVELSVNTEEKLNVGADVGAVPLKVGELSVSEDERLSVGADVEFSVSEDEDEDGLSVDLGEGGSVITTVIGVDGPPLKDVITTVTGVGVSRLKEVVLSAGNDVELGVLVTVVTTRDPVDRNDGGAVPELELGTVLLGYRGV